MKRAVAPACESAAARRGASAASPKSVVASAARCAHVGLRPSRAHPTAKRRHRHKRPRMPSSRPRTCSKKTPPHRWSDRIDSGPATYIIAPRAEPSLALADLLQGAAGSTRNDADSLRKPVGLVKRSFYVDASAYCLDLTVVTDPPGAQVYLKRFIPDESGNLPARQLIGTTPINHRPDRARRLRVSIEKEGYASLERSVTGGHDAAGGFRATSPPIRLEAKLIAAANVPARMALCPGANISGGLGDVRRLSGCGSTLTSLTSTK